jgi:2-amino-4-hydroxy-6-hydroxymethyldihydropteridine diphosphokinase
MYRKKVYLGLGSNIGDSVDTVWHACQAIEAIDHVYDFVVSRLYQTAPVSDIPQPDYINAVCRFDTDFAVIELWERLQAIEKMLGKIDKAKNAPRVIDIDILFYGSDSYDNAGLQIPHPRWKERLFVLVPLCDLEPLINVPIQSCADKQNVLEIDLKAMILQFPPREMEKQCIKCL